MLPVLDRTILQYSEPSDLEKINSITKKIFTPGVLDSISLTSEIQSGCWFFSVTFIQTYSFKVDDRNYKLVWSDDYVFIPYETPTVKIFEYGVGKEKQLNVPIEQALAFYKFVEQAYNDRNNY